MPKLILRAKVHRLVPNLFRAEVTRAEHRLPLNQCYSHLVRPISRAAVSQPVSFFRVRIFYCVNQCYSHLVRPISRAAVSQPVSWSKKD